MNQSKISVRYGKALFMAAMESKKLDQVRKDIALIMQLYAHKMFRDMIESPVVKTSEKRKIVDKILSGKISELSHHFISLLLVNKREIFFPAIARNFNSLYKQNMGIKSAELIVPKKVDDKFKSSFTKILKETYKSDIELEEKIRPEIIGGFILKVENEQYDASVLSGLAKMKKKLLESTSVNKI